MRLVPLKFFTAEIKEFILSKVLHGFPPPSNPQFNILLKYQSLIIHSSELKKKKEILTLSLDLNINKTKNTTDGGWKWNHIKVRVSGDLFVKQNPQTKTTKKRIKIPPYFDVVQRPRAISTLFVFLDFFQAICLFSIE